MLHRFRTAPSHEGPRDVFMYRPIASGVARVMISLGFDFEAADQLLGLPGAESAMLCEVYNWTLNEYFAGKMPERDLRQVLERWIAFHEVLRQRDDRHYRAVQKARCNYFTHPEWRQATSLQPDTDHRILWEVYEALGIWLKIDDYLSMANTLSTHYCQLLVPGGLAHFECGGLLREAFQAALGLPPHDAPRKLYLETMKQVIQESEIYNVGSLGFTLPHRLSQLCEERFRPFIMPLWPTDAPDRVQAVLERHTLQGMAGYMADEFLGRVLQVPGRLDNHDERSDMERRCFGSDQAGQAARRQARAEFLTWIRENGRELIDLVTPLGR